VSGNHVITEWTLRFSLTEPFYGGLKRTLKVSVQGVSIVRIENGNIAEWADYYDGLTSRRTALGAHFEEWVEL
jgi:limonene-1,2-epoxide hydrolase